MKKLQQSIKYRIQFLEDVISHGYSIDLLEADREQLDICSKLFNGNTVIIAGFPGIGKSQLFNSANYRSLKISDSDSSKFDKSDFPRNYIEHIKNLYGTMDIILVSSHDVVRNALVEAKLPFILVYPTLECKSEYQSRYLNRFSIIKCLSIL